MAPSDVKVCCRALLSYACDGSIGISVELTQCIREPQTAVMAFSTTASFASLSCLAIRRILEGVRWSWFRVRAPPEPVLLLPSKSKLFLLAREARQFDCYGRVDVRSFIVRVRELISSSLVVKDVA